MAMRLKEPFIILYMYEPDQLGHPTVHASHVGFQNEGLRALNQKIHSLIKVEKGAENCIVFRIGEATEILNQLFHECRIVKLLAHEETGHGISYERDKVNLSCDNCTKFSHAL